MNTPLDDPAAMAAEIASFMATDPGWEFATDPTRAVVHAVSRAATAHGKGYPGAGEVYSRQARLWTHVAVALVAAAASPHVSRGAVLDGLVERYGTGG